MARASSTRTRVADVQKPDVATVRRARRIVRILADTYPDVCCELDFRNPFELLVATVLSAQTTDRRVNAATPALFARFPNAASLAAADREELEGLVKTTGFFRAKSASLLGLAQALCDRFDGEVPPRMEDLVTLPGVGRKTANVVLGEALGIPSIPVDTHVMRLAKRFGWSDASADPVRIEQDIAALLPPREWTRASQLVIWHGRRCCHAKKAACGACPLARVCPSFGIGPTDPDAALGLLRDEGPA